MTKKTLSKISLTISSGLTPLRSNEEYWRSKDIPWVKTEQLGVKNIYDSNEKISLKALKETGLKLNPQNTLSVAMYGEGRTRGSVSILKKEMTTNQACCNIVLDPTKANYEYVYYFLKTQYNQLRNLSSGVRKNLNSNDLKNFEIRIPKDLNTQSLIAKVLSDLDAKIELNNKINAELEAMAKLIYDYWFVQFDFPHEFKTTKTDEYGKVTELVEVKPYKSSGGKMVWNAELKREIPEGWEVKSIAEYSNITTGKLDSNAEVVEGKYHFYTCASEPTKTDSYAFDDSVILIAGNNASGNFHINRFKGKFNAYQRTYVITEKFPNALNYIYWVLFYQMKNLKKKGNGSQTKFLTLGMIADTPVFSTKSNLFDVFAEITNPLYNKQMNILNENQKLAELRDWLLPMLMNGQVKAK